MENSRLSFFADTTFTDRHFPLLEKAGFVPLRISEIGDLIEKEKSLPGLVLIESGFLKSGEWTLSEIAGPVQNQKIPFVLLTDGEDERFLEDCRRAGISDFIGVPSNSFLWKMAVDSVREKAELRKEKSRQKADKEWKAALFRVIPDMYFRLNSEGTFLDFEAGGETLIPKERIIGANIRLLPVGKPALRKLLHGLAKALKTKDLCTVNYEALQGARLHYFEARFACLAENEVVAVVEDVTKRTEATHAVLQNKNRMQTFFDFLPDSYFTVNRRGEFIKTHETEEEGADKTLAEDFETVKLAQADRKKILEAVNRAFETGELQPVLYEKPAGSANFYEGRFMKIGPNEVMASVRDVTEDYRNRLAYQRSNERLSLATKAADLGIWEYFYADKRLAFDEKIAKIFDRPTADFSMEKWAAQIHPDDKDKVWASFSLKRNNSIQETEYRIIVNSTVRYLSVSSIYFEKSEGKPEKLTGTIRDITLRMNALNVIEAQKKELAERSLDLAKTVLRLEKASGILSKSLEKKDEALRKSEEAQKKLKEAQLHLVQSEKMSAIGQLTAGIAHEINNSINPVAGGILVLERNFGEIKEFIEAQTGIPAKDLEMFHSLYEESEMMIETIQLGASRTTEIVKELRTFSRMDENEKKYIDLHKNFEATIKLVRGQLLHTCTLNRDFSENLPKVRCFPGKINQVFLNLLLNASQAVGENGKIKVRTMHNSASGTVSFEVEDNGQGIKPENLDKIFDPFFTTKPVGTGTGLGLSVVHGIIKDHKGEISVRSEVGKGTVFIVTLPHQ